MKLSLEWLVLKRWKIPITGKNMKQVEFLCTINGSIKQYNYFGKLCIKKNLKHKHGI